MPVSDFLIARSPAQEDFPADVQGREIDHSPFELLNKATQIFDFSNVSIDAIDEQVQLQFQILGIYRNGAFIDSNRVLFQTLQFGALLNDPIPDFHDIGHDSLQKWQHLVGVIDGYEATLCLGATGAAHRSLHFNRVHVLREKWQAPCPSELGLRFTPRPPPGATAVPIRTPLSSGWTGPSVDFTLHGLDNSTSGE